MARSEKAILNETLIQVSAIPETMVYRQNTGQAWQGRPVAARVGDYVRVTPGMKILGEARPVSFGVPGGSDIIGVSHGRGLAIETKAVSGAQREQQVLFQQAWEKAGGLYILARSAEDAVNRVAVTQE